MHSLAFILLSILSLLLPVIPQESHEYAPLQEQKIAYKDWTYKSLKADAPSVNLRDWATGKKLVLVVYYAPWCGNWHNEAPVVARLYDKYHAQGLEVIAVNEYGSSDEARTFFAGHKLSIPVVVESEDRADREKTTHFGYRQTTGDTRRWGSPYNVFLEPATFPKQGDVLAEKAWVVNGELIEAEVEKFIRERLGIQ